MLLAVEGGGFFSSSASGYSNGLTLLLRGRKNEERPMRVSPWNQYQLVEREADPNLQLASRKNRVFCGCASFACFGRRTSKGIEGPSPPKVGPVQQQDMLSEYTVSEKGEDCIADHGDSKTVRKFSLKSGLKNPASCAPIVDGNNDSKETSSKNGTVAPGCAERRIVQWTDACGGELVEIREFEPSDTSGSDDELEGQNMHRCLCVIM